MSRRFNIGFKFRDYGWAIFFLVAAFMLLFSIFAGRRMDYSRIAARHASVRINARVAKLDAFMQKARNLSPDQWLDLEDLPSDMVIYRYVNDSLQSWNHRFNISNDDICHRMYFKRLSGSGITIESPLAYVDTVVTYAYMGPKLYILKSIRDGHGCEVIGGLEVKGPAFHRTSNSVNPRLGVMGSFSLYPISATGGEAIVVQGIPLFKVIQENLHTLPLLPDPVSLWISIFLILFALVIFQRGHKSVRALKIVLLLWTLTVTGFYFLGKNVDSASIQIFSPVIYADGKFFYSLGSLLLICLYIFAFVLCIYMCRIEIYKHLKALGSKPAIRFYVAGMLSLGVAVAVYAHFSLASIIRNSNIALGLFKFTGIGRYTVYVFLAYSCLMLTVPMILQSLRPYIRSFFGLPYRPLSKYSRVIYSVAASAYLLLYISMLSFIREENRVNIWANRLAIDRDLGFELQLRRVEKALALDPVLNMPINNYQDYGMAINRISENYLGRIAQDYDVSFYISVGGGQDDLNTVSFFESKLREAVPVADSSRIMYSRSATGRAQYTAKFGYAGGDDLPNYVYLNIASKSDRNVRGYNTILGAGGNNPAVVPPDYSYAKYQGHKLLSSKGEYAYPTIMTGKVKQANDEGRLKPVRMDGYVHFITHITEDETILISRPKEENSQYLVMEFILFLVLYMGLSIVSMKRKKQAPSNDSNYYKSSINTVIFLATTSTLVVLTAVSIDFVYKRNDANILNLMKGKINTISSLVESVSANFASYKDFVSKDLTVILDNFADYTKSDITIYSPEGKFLRSTGQETFDRLLVSNRIDEAAYVAIMRNHKSFFIHKEKILGRSFYAMYAPIFNSNGELLGIIASPYTDMGLDFRNEAIIHSLFIITLFIILLLLIRFFTTALIDKLFRPLTNIGKKMAEAHDNGMEYVIYSRNDEISSLVRSYNLMVHDLSESTKQMAQVERDKAWSEMARQVAHEIKNPLTPIKLNIQRVVRFKKNNNPVWEQKFDEVVPVIMSSIDELTDTANEFSTFAKLYSEEPISIDLDLLAKDALILFDARDDIDFQYFGLNNAMVMGPKPQLTRVFVNLLTNSVQAIDHWRAEQGMSGSSAPRGKVNLSIRNSTLDGFYDIVIEDNGPGVKDENLSNLFKPNFTTKSEGTGLGLAICKNILERCGGDISYSRSFTLRGACFTIHYPRPNS